MVRTLFVTVKSGARRITSAARAQSWRGGRQPGRGRRGGEGEREKRRRREERERESESVGGVDGQAEDSDAVGAQQEWAAHQRRRSNCRTTATNAKRSWEPDRARRLWESESTKRE
eukprot:15468274-Alexandrium_andersonii.AAC.1